MRAFKTLRLIAIPVCIFLLGVCGCGTQQEKVLVPDLNASGEAQTETPPASESEHQTQESDKAVKSDSPRSADSHQTQDDDDVTALFDGETLNGWEKIEFGGEGDIEVIHGEIRMFAGDPLTGICVTDDTELPTANYEISLDGMKLEGSDFFCAITFPVNDTFCTLVVGGWGGTLVGLSNLDGKDASDNDTKLNKKFEKERWYNIRLQVLPERITAWIDEEKLIDESIKDVEVSIRNDVISTTPLGITNFATTSALRDIKLRKLD
ncbi:3-keto-disaccharide hydrolase [Mariniblastus fucicola]|uniref:3-keto-alpha-glucoside-1,2-lyase/3-keto-2-hydroxy-glucal hydratase domain-containing protein n=1 Tax=Mariniblastus fucicola TaxID=980251 RepID=A0A5B9P3J4_9BACT|nr:DUF1080 domain-containing protein [Mariniblastus fucicola]QEG20968.1 hypothetical protein MFFC18_08190 [Mariniblastus fucicola]